MKSKIKHFVYKKNPNRLGSISQIVPEGLGASLVGEPIKCAGTGDDMAVCCLAHKPKSCSLIIGIYSMDPHCTLFSLLATL